jgi:hypothetical protein
VEAWERIDATEPAGDFGRDTGELSGAGRRRLAVESVVDLGDSSSPMVDVEDVRDSVRDIVSPGVSFESGLGPRFGN